MCPVAFTSFLELLGKAKAVFDVGSSVVMRTFDLVHNFGDGSSVLLCSGINVCARNPYFYTMIVSY